MSAVLVLLVLVPFAAVVACLFGSERMLAPITVGSGFACLALTIALVGPASSVAVTAGVLRVDALSVVFLLPTGFLYLVTACYSIGYLATDHNIDGEPLQGAGYARRFYVGMNLFAWAMLCAPAVSGLALLWIAVEVTTVVSALLVAIDDTEGATEAAWKYILIASSGLGIGLLATIVMYYAGSQVLGQSYDLAFEPLIQHAAQLPQTPVRLAFALAVVGFGTKVGLFPVHTWLPDAHAEAPSPVSALLSGSLLAISFYAILRYYQISVGALGAAFPRDILLGFGVASLLLAALYLFEQGDVKRMLAYSSVEHMGIIAIAVSFGTPLAVTGALLHVLAHGAAKGNAFMGAGVLVRKYGSKDLSAIRGAADLLPWSAPLFAASILALGAMPPFGLFRSEFQIVVGGFGSGRYAPAAVLVVLVTLAFVGLFRNVTAPLLVRPLVMVAEGADDLVARSTAVGAAGRAEVPATVTMMPAVPARGEPSGWLVAPVVAGLVALLVLGLDPPGPLTDLLSRAAAELGAGVP